MMDITTPVGIESDLLLPCPFCGGAAALEADPWLDACARVACGNGACAVKPKTEYLLLCYSDELCAAWNQRPAPAVDRTVAGDFRERRAS